jgi:hypothetical protein
MDMRYGAWKVRSLNRVGSLIILDLQGGQEVRMYIIRGDWCYVIVLNDCALTKDATVDA